MREIERLRAAMRETRRRHPFEIDEIVVLPDVLHALWTLPEGDCDVALRWRVLKRLFSQGLAAPAQGPVGAVGHPVWLRRSWTHLIRDAQDFETHRRMIHAAPVQAGLVERPEAWLFSSIHRASVRDVNSTLRGDISAPRYRAVTAQDVAVQG